MIGNIKISKKSDDVTLVFEQQEFDGLIIAFNEVIEINRNDYPKYSDSMQKVIENIIKYSYFDIEKKEVHTKLFLKELTTILEVLTYHSALIGEETDVNFESIIKDDTTKIWK